MMIKPGIYRHYKSKLYEVLNIAIQSETLEEMVVYKALYSSEFGDHCLWVRPLSMFVEKLEIGEKLVDRFSYEG